jgi:hypothetical protein
VGVGVYNAPSPIWSPKRKENKMNDIIKEMADVLRLVLDEDVQDYGFSQEFGGYVLDDNVRDAIEKVLKRVESFE